MCTKYCFKSLNKQSSWVQERINPFYINSYGKNVFGLRAFRSMNDLQERIKFVNRGLIVREFTLSLSCHHCSIFIHLPPTLHNVFLPVLQFSPRQYHSTIAPYSSIHLPPTLYNVSLPALQFSPVSIIPPLLHTHSFIYHPRCIMVFSQYFSFPLSVSFNHCSILIQPSTTHAV